MMNILIIGGSRFVGPLLVERLLKKEHRVTLFNRGIYQSTYSKVRFIQGDRNNGFSIPERFDAVIDMCAYTAKQTKTALRELHFDFYINFGTAAVYKKTNTFPLTEETEIGPWPLWRAYNKGKVACEKVLQKSDVRYASLRPVYILGKNNYMDREHFIYLHLKDKKPLILPGDGTAKIQFVFAQDVATALVLLAEKKVSGAFNCCGNEVVSLTEFVRILGKIVGVKPLIKYNKHTEGTQHSEKEFPFANETFYCTNNKLKELGIHFTSLVKGLKQDYEEYYKSII